MKMLNLKVPGSSLLKAVVVLILGSQLAWSARVKDIAQLDGFSEVQLVGYGLVVGLNGTGDGAQASYTIQSTINLLRNMGIEVPNSRIRTRNIAAVMVTANLKPFQKKGSKIDVTVSSMGDARSIEGGTLLMTPLQGPDGEIYALGQGALSVGGLSAQSSEKRANMRRNHILAGEIPNGALIQRAIATPSLNRNTMRWSLSSPDFSTAVNMAEQLNATYGEKYAKALDASTVEITLPEAEIPNIMQHIAKAENTILTPETKAKVILNEKSGTVVAGSDVRISEIAVSHGSIQININSEESISQPNGFSQGTTGSVIQEQIETIESPLDFKTLPEVTNVGELATALNTLGVAPRDIISIFLALKKAGALHAELVLM